MSPKHLLMRVPASVTRAAGSSQAVYLDFVDTPTVTCTYGTAGAGTQAAFVSCTSGAGIGSGVYASAVTIRTGSGEYPYASVGVTEDDGNSCTADACSGGTVTNTTNVADGTVCDTSNACAQPSTCQSGACQPGAAITPNDGDPCTTTDYCDPVRGMYGTGTCTSPPGVGSGSDPTLATDFVATTAAVVTAQGAQGGALDPVRESVVRGRVMAYQGQALQALVGATVRVLGQPAIGAATTRSDGWYDLVVNGGGTVVLAIDGPASTPRYLPVQRRVDARWHDFTVVDDVALLQEDGNGSSSSTITRGNPQWQVAKGGSVTEGGYTRQAVVLFPNEWNIDTGASGWSSPPPSLHLRITEFTSTAAGPAAMPGDLSASTGYTYADELAFEEATAAQVSKVVFTKDVIHYVDPVLDPAKVTVGQDVPAGAYDVDAGAWRPEASGKVVRILSCSSGMAVFDVPDGGALPAGITDGERAALCTTGPTGAYGNSSFPRTLWRVSAPHFSSWDFNWGFGPPPNAMTPTSRALVSGGPVRNSCKEVGSIIECESQGLAEEVPIPGTGLTLRYQSDRHPGYFARLSIPITDDRPLSPAPDSIEVDVEVAGRKSHQVLTSFAKNQSVTWTWDWKNAYGNVVRGSSVAHVAVAYVYKGVTEQAPAFSLPPRSLIDGDRANRLFRLVRRTDVPLESFDPKPLGLGGWTLTRHHVLDPSSSTLFRGDGSRRSVADYPGVLQTVVGSGTSTAIADGTPALDFFVSQFAPAFAVGPDGTLFLGGGTLGGAGTLHSVRSIPRSGLVGTRYGVPGNGSGSLVFVEGQSSLLPISSAAWPGDLAVEPDGSILVAQPAAHRVVRVRPNNTLSLVAGAYSGLLGPSGVDGGPAIGEILNYPSGVAVARDGGVLIADTQHQRVRKVTRDGRIYTIAGNGLDTGFPVDGSTNATAQPFPSPTSLVEGPHGAVYVSVHFGGRDARVVRVGPDGRVTIYAGGGTTVGNGGAATAAKLHWVKKLAMDVSGMLFVADDGTSGGAEQRIRRVDPQGRIWTVAGSGSRAWAADGNVAESSSQCDPQSVAVGPDGFLYFVQGNLGVGRSFVRRIGAGALTTATSYRVPSEDGREVYELDKGGSTAGRHTKTLHGLTGTELYEFHYDSQNRVDAITDKRATANNVTSIAYVSPTQVSITGPFGQVTNLTIGSSGAASGYLTQIAWAGGAEHVDLDYWGAGLLKTFTMPKGQVHSLTYDGAGRLVRDRNAVQGTAGTTLSAVDIDDGWKVTVATPEGRTRTHTVSRKPDPNDPLREERRTHTTEGVGNSTVVDFRRDGARKTTYPDGSTLESFVGSEIANVQGGTSTPRFGTLAPFTTKTVLTRADITGGLETYLEPESGNSCYQQGQQTFCTRTLTTEHSHTVTLANAQDPFSVTAADAVRDETWRHGDTSKKWTAVYSGTARTWTYAATPTGRSTVVTLGAGNPSVVDKERPVQIAVGGTGGVPATGLAPVVLGYDAAGRLHSVKQTVGGTNREIKNLFDDPSWPWPSRVQTPVGTVRFDARDAVGRPTTVVLPGSRTFEFGYDLNGNLTQLTPPKGGSYAHAMSSNESDLLSLYQPPNPTVAPPSLWAKDTSYSYDRDGLLTSFAAPAVSAVSFTTDAAGRPKQRVTPEATVLWSYDGATGDLASIEVSGGVKHTYTHAKGVLVKDEQTGGGIPNHTTQYWTDKDGRPWKRKIDGLAEVQFAYDADGYPTTVKYNGSDVLALTWGTNGLLTEIKSGTNLSVSETFEYEPGWGELKRQRLAGVPALEYTRDPATGRVTGKTESLPGATSTAYTFGYDSANRLSAWSAAGQFTASATHLYDGHGNRTNAGWTLDEQDRLRGDPDWACWFWKPNGELSSVSWYPCSYGDGWSTYAWTYDVLGNFRRVQSLSWYWDVGTIIDGMDRTAGVRVNGAFQLGYLYDREGRLVAKLDANGLLSQQYVYASKRHVPDLMIDAMGVAHRIVTDQLGSVRLVLSVAGTVEQRVFYDPWGLIKSETGTASLVPFGFAGGIRDPNMGFTRFGARDYDPWRGRWVSKDRTRFEGGFNLYAYCENDPVNCVDPSGFDPVLGPALDGIGLLLRRLRDMLSHDPEPSGDSFGPGEGGPCKPGDYCPLPSGGGGWPGGAAISPPPEPATCDGNDEADDPCEAQYQQDLASCRAIGKRSRARGARCYEAAMARMNACRQGMPLPPLHGWWQ